MTIKDIKIKRDRVSDFVVRAMEEESQITKGKYAADISSIKEAHARIKSLVHKTPLLSSSSLTAVRKAALLQM
ncbi:hypothetical protein JHK85_020606 [Glycine max]|nr:hypothetical protein JHK85_020606 [Glycine max]